MKDTIQWLIKQRNDLNKQKEVLINNFLLNEIDLSECARLVIAHLNTAELNLTNLIKQLQNGIIH